MNLRTFTPLGWAAIAAGVVVVLVALAGAYHLVTAPARDRASAAAAKVTSAQAAAQAASAHDAVEVTDRARDRDAAEDQQTRNHADDIRQAPGAEQRLDPALNRVGLRSLCERAAYRAEPECVQLARSVQPSQAGSGRAASRP